MSTLFKPGTATSEWADWSETLLVRRPTLASTQAGTKVEKLIEQQDAALRAPRYQPPCCEDPDAGQDPPVLSDKIYAAEGVVLPQRSQSWVQAVCSQRRLIAVEPRAALFAKPGISTANRVAQVAPSHPFRHMVVKVGEKPYHLHLAHPNRIRYSWRSLQ